MGEHLEAFRREVCAARGHDHGREGERACLLAEFERLGVTPPALPDSHFVARVADA